MKPLSLVVLISGRGSNMEAIINACKDDGFPAKVSAVITDNPHAGGLKVADQAQIATEVVNFSDFSSKKAFETDLKAKIEYYSPDLICLAGFMRVLSSDFVADFPDRIINIHPSLLPDYPGLNVHERVLADKRDKSGCTVHYVTAEVDAGPIIIQKSVDVYVDDTPQTLASRVLEQEHDAYPESIKIIASRK